MRIAILGGGLTGLTAAYELAKKNHNIVVLEKENRLGGLASGFKKENFKWYLEKNIHHLFSNDKDILKFSKEIGFDKIFFKLTKTGSLYNIQNNSRIIPLDTPQDLLAFPTLSIFDKVRTGIMLVFLKLTPNLKLFEKITAKEFIIRFSGKRAWKVLWEELFRKKFGKYAGIILSSFFWARIKKRTKKLGYIKGGFQELINHIEKKSIMHNVKIYKNCEIKEIKKTKNQFIINNQRFDKVICTLQTPIITRIASNILPKKYIKRLKKIKYIHSVSVILESKKQLIDNFYWINILDRLNKIMCIVTHTNFIDKANYGNKIITYMFNYVDEDSEIFIKKESNLSVFYIENMQRINPKINKEIISHNTFFNYYSQPIYDKIFIKNKPNFITPLKNFYIANLDMTYPFDRGTNYAIKIGKKVASFITH